MKIKIFICLLVLGYRGNYPSKSIDKNIKIKPIKKFFYNRKKFNIEDGRGIY